MSARDACDDNAEKHRIEENDLLQQRRAADATEAAALFAFEQSRTLLIGTILSLLTAFAAGVAVVYSKKSADVAAREQTIRDRPQIWVGQVQFRPQVGKDLIGTLLIVNQGNSDARISHRSFGHMITANIGQSSPIDRFAGLNSHGEKALGPGSKNYENWKFLIPELSKEDIDDIRTGPKKLYFFGRFIYTYSDNIPEHHSLFAFEYNTKTDRFDLVKDRNFTLGVVDA